MFKFFSFRNTYQTISNYIKHINTLLLCVGYFIRVQYIIVISLIMPKDRYLTSPSRGYKKRLYIKKAKLYNTLRPRQNGRHFPDDIFKCIFLNENAWILIKISLKFVPNDPISNVPAFVQIMAWCRLGDKPSSEQMLACSPTHICVSRPQWVKHKTCCMAFSDASPELMDIHCVHSNWSR